MKKIILGGLILSSLFVGFTNATTAEITTGKVNNTLYTRYDLSLPGEFGYVGSSYINNEIFTDGSIEFGQFVMYTPYSSNRYYTFGRVQGKPYGIAQYSNSTLYSQGYINNRCQTNNDNIIQDCYTSNFEQSYNTTREEIDKNFSPDTFIQISNAEGNLDYKGMFCFKDTAKDKVLCWYYDISYSSTSIMSGGNLVSTLDASNEGSRYNIFDEGSPFIAGGPDTEGGPISCINIKTQIMLYGNKYNTGMCYTNGLYFSGFTPIQTGKLSIFEVFPSYEDYQNMANRYNTYCHAPYTQEYCAEAMNGYEQGIDFFTTIKNTNNNSVFTVEADKLYQYCHLQLNFTEEEKRAECEETTDNFYATGVNQNSLPNPFEGVSEYIENEINLGIPTPATGSVLDELLTTDDEGKIKLELLKRVQQFKEIYNKITSLFKYRNTQQGVIPGYITSLLLIIILLALFKK